MVKEVEGTIKIGDVSLYTKTWLPDSTPVAKLVFVHGFSDHIGRYYDFFPTLARRGVAVYTWDQRGWGRSVNRPAERGLTGPTARVLADMATFFEHAAATDPPAAPVFVMGHSMGGGQVLTLASAGEYDRRVNSRVRGWLLEAPFIAFTPGQTPSALKVVAGRLAGKLLPRMHLANPIPPEDLCRDPAVQQSLRDDKLCHDTGTLEGLSGLLDRTGDLSSGKAKLSKEVKRLWLGHGSEDKATSYEASKKWFEAQAGLEDKTFKTYDGWYHQLHAEPEKDVFYKDVGDWILARCEAHEAQPSSTAAPAAEGSAHGESKL